MRLLKKIGGQQTHGGEIVSTFLMLAGVLVAPIGAQPIAQYTFDDGTAMDVTGNGYGKGRICQMSGRRPRKVLVFSDFWPVISLTMSP